MKISVPLPGGKRLELGVVSVVEVELPDFDPETLKQIDALRKEGQTREQVIMGLISQGMMTEAYRLSGADIVKRDSGGQETVIYPAEK